jgi:hypothetical protein
MRRSVSLILLLILAAACGSTTMGRRPATVAQPEIRVEPVGSLFFGSTSTAPISFDVEIRNRAQTALIVREIEITAPTMAQWTVRPTRRTYNETIAAGASQRLTLFSTAVTGVRDPTEPLSIRTIVTFEGPDGTRWREILQR